MGLCADGRTMFAPTTMAPVAGALAFALDIRSSAVSAGHALVGSGGMRVTSLTSSSDAEPLNIATATSIRSEAVISLMYRR